MHAFYPISVRRRIVLQLHTGHLRMGALHICAILATSQSMACIITARIAEILLISQSTSAAGCVSRGATHCLKAQVIEVKDEKPRRHEYEVLRMWGVQSDIYMGTDSDLIQFSVISNRVVKISETVGAGVQEHRLSMSMTGLGLRRRRWR